MTPKQEYMAKYYRDRIEEKRERNRLYYAANKERLSASARGRMAMKAIADPKAVKAKRLAYYQANSEKCRAYTRDHYQKNKKRNLAYAARRRQQLGLDKLRDQSRKWSAANKDKVLAFTRARYARKMNAIPAWSNRNSVQQIYAEARRLSVATGQQYQVDHIVPLKSELVCGLHVENNLQVILRHDNAVKGNRVWPDMPKGEECAHR